MLSHRLELKGHIQTIVNVLFKIIDLLVSSLKREKATYSGRGVFCLFSLHSKYTVL